MMLKIITLNTYTVAIVKSIFCRFSLISVHFRQCLKLIHCIVKKWKTVR